MASAHEAFWTHSSYAFVGNAAKKPFPEISYRALKRRGTKVFAVDPSGAEVGGDAAYRDLRSLPEPVEALVLEVPREETLEWLRQAAEVGVRHVWVHMNRDTPEAVAFARQNGMSMLTGTCAAMYVTPGFTYHSVHRWLNKVLGKY